ncbi:MAG: nitroreductase family protein [Spirochaetes bacterium]|nr:nitroreductase family protein [Spirochaetota bacterium]
MKAVTIDKEKCNLCLVCVETSAGCFMKNDDSIEVLADDFTCVLCGHCVAACPVNAITHNIMDMSNFPEITGDGKLSTGDLLRHMRERRSHRAFLDKQVPKKDLEKLAEAVRYSPTGHNEQTVELVIIQNPERRKKLSNLGVDFYAGVADEAEKGLEEMKASGKAAPEQILESERTTGFLRMLAGARDAGLDPLLYDAPAVFIFHSTAKAVTASENCVIAAANAGMLARTMGLETTFVALFASAANTYPPLTGELGLPEGNKVYAVLVVGYPKIRYLRAVDRKQVSVRWE